jgi:hypothetical protein
LIVGSVAFSFVSGSEAVKDKLVLGCALMDLTPLGAPCSCLALAT